MSTSTPLLNLSNDEKTLDHWMYVWAVEMASVWDARGDLDGYCYWWSWRIEDRWDEEERVAYEAWKYGQLSKKFGTKVWIDEDREADKRTQQILRGLEQTSTKAWVAEDREAEKRIQRVLRDSNKPLHGMSSRSSSRTARVLLAHTAMMTGFSLPAAPPRYLDCKHMSGFFGGFSSCSACGISERQARRQRGT